MNKKLREEVRLKYSGLCAYTGKPLDEKWQVDHILPVSHGEWIRKLKNGEESYPHSIENLLPALRIINHYKRCRDLEAWRKFLLTLHERLKKLPRNTYVPKSIRHKEYLLEVADAFGITTDNPFTGKFYFETITK